MITKPEPETPDDAARVLRADDEYEDYAQDTHTELTPDRAGALRAPRGPGGGADVLDYGDGSDADVDEELEPALFDPFEDEALDVEWNGHPAWNQRRARAQVMHILGIEDYAALAGPLYRAILDVIDDAKGVEDFEPEVAA